MSIKRKYLLALEEIEKINKESKDVLDLSKKVLDYLRKTLKNTTGLVFTF